MSWPALVFLLFLLPLHGAEGLFRKPVIIGASLSDGFDLGDFGVPLISPGSRELGMHHFLDAARGVKGERILNFGSNWMFLAPGPKGDFQIKKAHEADPTVVFAVDFLFWYLYGNEGSRSEEDLGLTRLEFFGKGLAKLATLECPVVVGNIPDARKSVGVIISPAQYPGAENIKVANQQLDRWLKAHPRMVKIDLAGFHRMAINNEAIKMGDFSLPAGKTRETLMQWDLLHPTQAGVRTIVEVAVAELKKNQK